MRCIAFLPAVRCTDAWAIFMRAAMPYRKGRLLLAPTSDGAAFAQHQNMAYSAVGQQHVANLVVFRQFGAKAVGLPAVAAAVWLAYDPQAIYLTRRMRGAVLDIYG